MKIKGMLIVLFIFIGAATLMVTSLDIGGDIGQYGYKNLWNATGQDLQVDNIIVDESLEVVGNIITQNITIRKLIKLQILEILPTCSESNSGGIARNSTKLYFCDGIVWNELY